MAMKIKRGILYSIRHHEPRTLGKLYRSLQQPLREIIGLDENGRFFNDPPLFYQSEKISRTGAAPLCSS
jgi:hypothetical protein